MDRKQISQIHAVVRKKVREQYSLSVTQRQALFSEDLPAIGPMWASRVIVPADGKHEIIQAIEEVIHLLGDGSEIYDVPFCIDIKAEWVGYRSGVDKKAPEPKISEKEKYNMLMKDVKNELVLFYIHGGAGFTLNSANCRPMTSRLAANSGGRVFSMNYRLAPQSAFPAQLVDVFLSYLTLLYPPPSSAHSPVLASKIVIVGDSFGSIVALSLIQLLLKLNNYQPVAGISRNILFNGRYVPLPLPSGVAFACPYSHTPEFYPSWKGNSMHDVFSHKSAFWMEPGFQNDAVWPTTPPRGDILCNISMLGHPLISAASATSWRGAPPMYFASGQEGCRDSAAVIACQAARDGVTVCWEEYESMSHIFMILFSDWEQSKMFYNRWTDFAKKCADQKKIKTMACIIETETLKEREVDINTLTDWTPKVVNDMLEPVKEERMAWMEKWRKVPSVL